MLAMTTMEEICEGIAVALFIGIPAFIVFFSAQYAYRKRKYGCSRCGYRVRSSVDGRIFCSASCGNNRGEVCPAWIYRDPNKECGL